MFAVSGTTAVIRVKTADQKVQDYPVTTRDGKYETAVVNVELHDACKEWVVPGSRVLIGTRASGVSATVSQINVPLQKFVKTSKNGFLDVGHVLLKGLSGATKKIDKLKLTKGKLFHMDGKGCETASAAAQGSGMFYCHTSVLLKPDEN